MLRELSSRDNRWATILILLCVVTIIAIFVAAFTVDLKPVFQVQAAVQVTTYTDANGQVTKYSQPSLLPIGANTQVTQVMTKTTTISPLSPAGR